MAIRNLPVRLSRQFGKWQVLRPGRREVSSKDRVDHVWLMGANI